MCGAFLGPIAHLALDNAGVEAVAVTYAGAESAHIRGDVNGIDRRASCPDQIRIQDGIRPALEPWRIPDQQELFGGDLLWPGEDGISERSHLLQGEKTTIFFTA